MMGCSWLYIHEHRMTLLGLLICRKLILTLSIRNMTVLKLEDIRIMEDIMIILSFITTPLNLFLFRGEVETDYYFWKETRNEISLDTKSLIMWP